MKSLIESFIQNRLFMYLGMVFIFLSGVVSLIGLRRDAFPNVDLKQMVISTKFPGASPADVELRVTYPIEEKLKEIDGIDEIRSFLEIPFRTLTFVSVWKKKIQKKF